MRLNNIIVAILTSLFVFAMPLSAASSDELTPPSAGCVTYEQMVNDITYEKLKEQNGTIVEVTGVQASALQERIEELVAKPAPFKADKIVMVNPNGDQDGILNIAFFEDNCLKAVLHLPAAVVNVISGPSVPLDERGKI